MATKYREEGGIKVADHILDVPYRSQRLDIAPYNQPHRACGMTCVWMALAALAGEDNVLDLDQMVALGSERGGLIPNIGWGHDYLVKTIQGYGIQCRRDERMEEVASVELFMSLLDGRNPVLISVRREEGSHLILLTGYRISGETDFEGFFYHEPDTTTNRKEGVHKYLPMVEFFERWRHMAIMPVKPADWSVDSIVDKYPPHWGR